jgi:hypothetical protein
LKIHIITSYNLLTGLDVARFLGADIALAKKGDNITVAYILTPVGDNLMSHTGLRKQRSEATSTDFYPLPFDLDSVPAYLASKFDVEYLTGDEVEEDISLTCHKILARAIMEHDSAWFGWWINELAQATGADIRRLDLVFMEKVIAMRDNSVITATSKEVRRMAEDIVLKHPKSEWDSLASEKGKGLIVHIAK